MLYKIILKNYRNHLKNYIAFFACSVCNIALFFAFWGMQDTFGETQNMNNSVYFQYDMLGDYMVMGILVTVMTVSMMLFAQKNYIRFRIRDYQFFLVLGMTRKKFMGLFALEYILNWTVSFVFGLLAGQGIFKGMVVVLGKVSDMDLESYTLKGEVYRNTCLTGLLLMVVVFFALMTWMEGKELGEFVQGREYQEKRPKGRKWYGIAILGSGVISLSVLLFQQGGWGWIWAHPIWILGGMIMIVSIGGIFLEWFRKQKFYLRNLLKLNFLYSQFLNNVLFVLVLFSVHFTVLGYAANQMAMRIPLEPDRSLWTWDYIWIGRKENLNYASMLAEKYGGEVENYPMIRVVTASFDEQIGISASVYNQLTGEKINLKKQEILVSIPGQQTKERQYLDKENGSRYRHLMMGKYTENLRERFFPFTSTGNYTEEMTYEVTAVVSENLLGDYTRSIAQIGFFRGSAVENVIVFSDEYFQEQWEYLSNNEEEPDWLLLFKIPKNQSEEVGNELSAYTQKQGIQSLTGCQNYYDTKLVLEEIKNGKTFAFMFVVLAVMDIFFCAVMIYGLKLLSDYEGIMRRYKLLDSLGMRWKEQKRNIRMETACDMYIALGGATALSGIYTYCNFWVFITNGYNPGNGFWIRWLGIVGGYILLNIAVIIIYTKCMQLFLRKKIEREDG